MPAPLTPDDLYRFRWVDHVRLSPGGDQVAYQIGWADAEARENRGEIFVHALEGGAEPVALPGSGRRDHSPEWSPDGTRVAFLGRTGARDQVYIAAAGGGEATRLTHLKDGVEAVRWSPDGQTMALLAPVLTEPDAVVDDPRAPEVPDQPFRPPVVRVARTLDHKRDGAGYFNGRRTHLFVLPAAGGQPRQLTDGRWSVESLEWSPDGRTIAVIGDAEPDADRRRQSHLHRVGMDGSRRLLVRAMKASVPAWSPDGSMIAFLAPLGQGAGFHERVWVVPADGGAPRCLTAGLDRACDGGVITDMRAGHAARLAWSEDGSRVLFLASGPGTAEICSVDLAGEVRVELPAKRRVVYEFDLWAGRLAACVTDPGQPGEVMLVEAGEERRLTDCNPWLRERYVAAPERHAFTAADGLEMEGWLLGPPGPDPGHPLPLVMEIHGGPHGQYGWAFFHEFQVLAGMGFKVLYVNPRGSDGYGEEFKRAVVGDWAGADQADLMTALDQLISRTGLVDTERMGVGGGSYGGYMTNWIVGQTDRFRAAVAMRSISNLVSDYAQHDIVPWFQEEVGPAVWTSPDELWCRSPIRWVENIRTPLLLTHGEMDLRCPISQADELFGALRLLGREVEMVRFPGESHDLSRSGRPDRRVERLRRIADWFERHLLE